MPHQSADWFAMTDLSVGRIQQLRQEVFPFGISALNKQILLFPAPALDLLFPFKRRVYVCGLLKIDKLRNIIPRGEALGICVNSMLLQTPVQIVGHAGVNRRVGTIRKEVDIVVHRFTRQSDNMCHCEGAARGNPHPRRRSKLVVCIKGERVAASMCALVGNDADSCSCRIIKNPLIPNQGRKDHLPRYHPHSALLPHL